MSRAPQKFSFQRAWQDFLADTIVKLIAGGFLLTIICLFIPWYSEQYFTVRQLSSPRLNNIGLLVSGLSIAGLLLFFNVFNMKKNQARYGCLLAALGLLVTLWLYKPETSPQFGYWIALGAAAVSCLGIILYIKKE